MKKLYSLFTLTKKWKEKKYIRHTVYPGVQRETTRFSYFR